MSSIIGEKDRRIVPRWRPSAQARDTSITLTKSDPEDARRAAEVALSVESNRLAWEQDPSLWNALDYVAGAIVAGKLNEAEGALHQIRTDPRSPKAATSFINFLENPAHPTDDVENLSFVDKQARIQIRESRQKLNEFPWDAISWIDLARGFTNLGLADKASRCVMAALRLSPTSRFVLRASARFYVHRNDPERAQSLLRKAPNLLKDPWLLASEIAVSSLLNRKSLYAREGIRLLNSDFAPQDLTELGAALGTLETDEGNNQRAKKFLRQSLFGANENSIAQIEWIDRTRLGGVIDVTRVNPPEQHEALAWRNFFEGDWDDAATESNLWFQDQPFSKNAGILNSYVLLEVTRSYSLAIENLHISLRCNPGDSGLLNNLAYAHIQQGELESARGVLAKIPADNNTVQGQLVAATCGLLEFRQGNHEIGRQLYLGAIDFFGANQRPDQAARAATYLAIEEVKARSPEMAEAVKRSLDLTKDSKRPDIAFKVDELETLVRKFLEEKT